MYMKKKTFRILFFSVRIVEHTYIHFTNKKKSETATSPVTVNKIKKKLVNKLFNKREHIRKKSR